MNRLVRSASTACKKPARICSFPIIAGIIGANAAGAALGHLQALGNIVAGAISDCIGGQILQTIPALAGLSGGLEWSSITGQVVGGAAGVILTLMVGLAKETIFAQKASLEG